MDLEIGHFRNCRTSILDLDLGFHSMDSFGLEKNIVAENWSYPVTKCSPRSLCVCVWTRLSNFLS